MVVSYTNYDTAIVYFCFRYRPGRKDQCQRGAMHAEIMSRSTKPKKKFIKDYLKRIQKRLCVSPKDMHATKPGTYILSRVWYYPNCCFKITFHLSYVTRSVILWHRSRFFLTTCLQYVTCHVAEDMQYFSRFSILSCIENLMYQLICTQSKWITKSRPRLQKTEKGIIDDHHIRFAKFTGDYKSFIKGPMQHVLSQALVHALRLNTQNY